MTATGSPSPVNFVPPDWVVSKTARGAEVESLAEGGRLVLEGQAAAAALGGDVAPLRSLSQVEPLVGRFAADLAETRPSPLTRQALLRGGGWRQLFIELSARCNEACVHCYAESSPERTETLDHASTMNVLDDARVLGFAVVQLTGGDPLIADTFLPALRRATSLGFETVEVYTNGLALRGQLLEDVCELRPNLAFSFYDSDPLIHDAITRVPGSQARTAKAIAAAAAAGLEVRVSIIVLAQNQPGVRATIAFVETLGVPPEAISLDVQRGVGRGTFATESDSWDIPVPGSSSAGHRASDDSPRFGGVACVGYDGIVYPCIFSRHLPLGDVRKGGLREALTREDVVTQEHGTAAAGAWRQQLACSDCRVRSALLAGPPRPVLTTLSSRRTSPGPEEDA